MSIPSQYLRLRSAQPYLTAETTAGSYVAVSAGDAFTTVDPLSLAQTFNTTDINEVGTRLLQNRSCLNFAERATYDMTFLVKPSGTAGTAPAEDSILSKIFGTKTVSSGTSVTYSFSRISSTFQAAQIVDEFMLAVSNGTIIEGFSMDISRTGVLQMTANARASRIRYAGPVAIQDTTATVDDSAAVTITIELGSGVYVDDYLVNGLRCNVLTSGGSTLNSGNVTISAVGTDGTTCALQADTGDSFDVDATNIIKPLSLAATGSDVSVTDASGATVTLTSIPSGEDVSDYFFDGMTCDVFTSGGTQKNTDPATISNLNTGADQIDIQAASGDSFTVSDTDVIQPVSVTVSGDRAVVSASATTVELATAANTVAGDYVFNTMQVDVFDASDTIKNTGAATISNSSTTTNTVQITAASGDSFTVEATDYIVPHLPTPTLSTYESLCPGTAQLFLGTQNAVIGTGSGELFDPANEFLATGFSLNVSKNLGDPSINELTGDLYPSAAYVSQNFDITGSFEFVMRPAQIRRFQEFSRRQQIGIGLQIGDTSGRIIRIAIPSARVNISMTDQDGAAAASVDWSLTQGSSTTDAGAFSLIYL